MNFFKKKVKDQDQGRTNNGGTQSKSSLPQQQKQQQQQQQQPVPNPMDQWSNVGIYLPPPAQQQPQQQNPYHSLEPQQQQMFAQQQQQEYLPLPYFPRPQPLQRQQYDFDEYHNSIVNDAIAPLLHAPAPYPIVSSGVPLGHQGQSQSTGYSTYPAQSSTYINDADNYTHNNNTHMPSSLTVANSSKSLATGQVLPPLSRTGSYNPPVLQRRPSYTSLFPARIPNAPVLAKREVHYFYSVVIGIDFGMRYSVATHSFREDEVDNNQNLYNVTSWPRHGTTIGTERVPTLSTYRKDSKRIAHWGYRAREEMRKSSAEDYVMLHNVKMHLDDRYIVRQLPNGLTVLHVIADYLREINECILAAVRKGIATNAGYLRYSLTVPGHWSARSKDTMREAAIIAGLVQPTDPPQHLMVISEEEAMAIYALRQTAWGEDLEEMDQFLLCHAPEGESVTLVVYEISKSVGRVQQLREVIRSFGPSCGSDFLDANMERLIERKLRNYRHIIPASDWEAMMTSFETGIRSIFDGLEDQFVHIPSLEEIDDEEVGLEDGYLVLTATEMREDVFEPVVVDVVGLMRDMLQRGGRYCKALFMLGEFGSSQYMWGRIKQEFDSQVAFIGRPPRPELAISRGAVYAGLDSYMKR